MTADLLREAAALMRKRAEDADTSGAWEVGARYQRNDDWIRPVYDDDGTVAEIHEGDADGAPESCEELAEHIASWHPDVAKAVARLLDAEAEFDETMKRHGARGLTHDSDAAKVAAAYLGRPA